MKQLKEKQQIKDGPEWANMNARQKQEFDANMRQIGNMARYHNVMGNKTIYTLQMLTDVIKSIFCHEVMVDRIAAMLNYFLLHLVCALRVYSFHYCEYWECALDQWNIWEQCAVFFRTCSGCSK